MHPGAFEFVGRYATNDDITVIEIGSRNINGTVRAHFPNARWFGMDLYPGEGVDLVADAAEYDPEHLVDLVVCCEVFEHCHYWQYLIHAASRWLKQSGRLIITCAGPGREPHSAIDGGDALHPDEHYANISVVELSDELRACGFRNIEVSGNEYWKDTYAIAMKA